MSEHHLLSEEEALVVLDKLKVERDKLPKIKMDDPAIQYLASIHGEVKEGSVIKIIRESETAGEFIVYRLVIKG
ncbi:MAG: DNA-directed RNA polymerase subunit H [archaeon]|nr:DNA-directed RNA polymerase subunit H [archaeon]